MNPAIYILSSMTISGLTFAIIFALAWTGFGRPRHALTWSVSYALAALEWGVQLASLLWFPDVSSIRAVTLSIGLLVTAVMTLGFRQRAELRPHAVALFGVTAIACAVVSLASVFAPGTMIDRLPAPMFLALMLGLNAATLVRPGTSNNAAERSAFVVLGLFSLYHLLAALLAIGRGMANGDADLLYRQLMLFGTPAAFTTVGLFAVFLLAADLSEKMRRLAILDPLTAILNRRGLEQAAAAAIANSQRQRLPLTLVLADLDRFKAINDNFGHAAGDRALQRFARHVEGAIRKGDCFGRIGGEEFALVLMNSNVADAMEVTERIRAGIEQLDAGAGAGGEVRLTASFGVAGLHAHDRTLADIMVRADDALYRSKMEGRNRITMADAPPPPQPSAAPPVPAATAGRPVERRQPARRR